MKSQTDHNQARPSSNRILFRVFGAAIASVSLFGGAIANAQAPDTWSSTSKSGNQPLVTSQLYLADASMCEIQSDKYQSYPCPPGYFYDTFVSTIWAVSVTNPNKSATAQNVRARVILLDAAGNEVMNKVMQVAASLSPGQTTWLAPTGSLDYDNEFEVDVNEGRGLAVSGSVTVLAHAWGRNTKTRTVRVPLTFANRSYCDETYENGGCNLLQYNGVFPNPGKEYSGYQTVLFFGDSGSPIAGIRLNGGLTTSIRRGGGTISGRFGFPKSLASRIADAQLFVTR